MGRYYGIWSRHNGRMSLAESWCKKEEEIIVLHFMQGAVDPALGGT